MASGDSDRSKGTEGTAGTPPVRGEQEDSKIPPDAQSVSRVGSLLTYAIFIIAPPAAAILCLVDLILDGRWWFVLVVLGVSVIATILGWWGFGVAWIEAILIWAITAIMVCVAISIYDDFSKRRARRHVGMLECPSMSRNTQPGSHEWVRSNILVLRNDSWGQTQVSRWCNRGRPHFNS